MTLKVDVSVTMGIATRSDACAISSNDHASLSFAGFHSDQQVALSLEDLHSARNHGYHRTHQYV